MKRLGKLITSEWFLFGLFSSIIIIAGTIATPYRSSIAKPGTMYDGTEFYSDDFSVYASYINEGIQGRWTVIDKHTTEPHNQVLIHEEYLLWGKLMGIFGFDAVGAYHLGRIFFGSIFLLCLYLVLRKILPFRGRLFAFLVILFSTGFPIITTSPEGNLIIRNQMEWFTEIDVFQKFTVLIHYLLGNIFFILSFFALVKTFSKEKYKFFNYSVSPLPVLILTSMGIAFTHPANFLVFYLMVLTYLSVSTVFRLIISKYRKPLLFEICKKEVFPALLVIIFSCPIIIYFYIQNSSPVWVDIGLWDKVTQYYIPIKDFAKTLGYPFFLAPIGFFALIFINNKSLVGKLTNVNQRQIAFLLFAWIVSYFSLFYYSYPYLHISQIRFMQNFIFIPFDILTVIGVGFIANLFQLVIPEKGNLLKKMKKNSVVLLPALYITVMIITGLPAYYRSMELKLTIFSPNDPLMFPDITWVNAIKWLSKNSNPDDPVIAAWHASHAIPYLGGNTVYVGHMWSTINKEAKEKKLYRFLGAKMTEQEMKNFLKETTAKYLFFGYQEKFYGLKPETLPFLTKIFDNSTVQIYKFQP